MQEKEKEKKYKIRKQERGIWFYLYQVLCF